MIIGSRPVTKYTLGTNPCRNCSSGRKHAQCRPRLDNTLCSCSCPKSVQHRQRVVDLQLSQPGLSDEEYVIRIAPRLKNESLGDTFIPAHVR